jgi:hypothetical protein
MQSKFSFLFRATRAYFGKRIGPALGSWEHAPN